MTGIMGIINITPDSFSDGGRYSDKDAALAHAAALISAGADMLDIGAESTRPGATPISAEAEWQRLAPILPELLALARGRNTPVSLDTRHAETANKALALGVDWINDVSAGGNEALVDAVAASHAGYIVMHSLGVPASKTHVLPPDCDPVAEITRFFGELITKLERRGISRERLILDPGIGFGKTAAHSMQLLWYSPQWQRELGVPLLIGHSRKSFLTLAGGEKADRDSLTLLASSFLFTGHIGWIRVHDINAHVTLRKTLEKSRAT